MKKITILVFMIMGLLLAACVGTGKTGMKDAQKLINDGSSGKVVVLREGGFAGAGAAMTIFLNGKKVGDLGNGQFLSIDAASGENKIEATVTGIQGIGLNKPALTFTKKASGHNYFVVGFENLLLVNQVKLTETTQSGFVTSLQNYERNKKKISNEAVTDKQTY